MTVPTEIFVPHLHYSQGFRVEVSDGTTEIERPRQLVIYHHDPDRHDSKSGEHRVRITPA